MGEAEVVIKAVVCDEARTWFPCGVYHVITSTVCLLKSLGDHNVHYLFKYGRE
jgi:hypothetical protein